MTDPGTALGGISLAIEVTRDLIRYYEAYRSYSADIERTVTSVENFLRSLEQIESLIQPHPDEIKDQDTIAIRDQLKKNASTSRNAFETLRSEWNKVKPDPGKTGVRATLEKHGKRVLYPFQKENLVALQTAVADARSNLQIGVSTTQLHHLGVIESSVQEAADSLGYMKSKQELNDMKSWLEAPDHSAKHRAARARHQEGTGEWFIKGSNFEQWLSQPQVLWLTGDPGCGKTVLCSQIIDETRRNVNSTAGKKEMAYFYFSYDDRLNATTDKLMRSLICQLSFTESHCAPELEEVYRKCQMAKDTPTQRQLVEVLSKLINSFEGTYIILDALNEAPDYSDLWRVFSGLPMATLKNTHLLLVSQNWIQTGLNTESIHTVPVQIDLNTVNDDIRHYLREESRTSPRLRRFQGLQSNIEESLMEKAGGMFQLVSNQLDRLKDCQTEADVYDVLHSVPENLDETWQRCFYNIKSKSKNKRSVDRAISLLAWLCHSQEPMRVEQIIEALALPNGWADDFDLGRDRLQDSALLLEIGAGLVKSDQSSSEERLDEKAIVRLAHSTVKDWLLSESMSVKNFSGSSPFSESTAHSVIARSCINYLMLFNTESITSSQNIGVLGPFAATWWPYHLRKSDYNPELVRRTCKFLAHDKMVYKWLMLRSPRRNSLVSMKRQQGTALFHAAEEGLDPIIEHLLAHHAANVNEHSETWRNPLESASRNDHASTVRLLLDSGAKVNGHGQGGRSALHWACDQGSPKTIEMLLKAGAKAGTCIEGLLPPLSRAARRDSDEVIRLLMHYQATVNLRGVYLQTALHVAAENSKLSNVQTLLEYNADKTLRDDFGRLPLHLAVEQEQCSREMASALYFDGAESILDDDDNTPVFLALDSNNEVVCQYMVDVSSNLQVPVSQGTAGLVDAAKKGFLFVVSFLHEKGAGFVAGKESALHNAAIGGHTDVISYLLQHGQDVNSLDSNGATAFLNAITQSEDKTWKCLVDHGANIHALNNKRQNACNYAVRNGELTTLCWLVEKGVQINEPDDLGMTPLHYAARYRNSMVLQFLIKNNADLHVISKDGANVCHYAAANGNYEALTYLVDHGADARLSADDGNTPYHDAIVYGKLECVKLLAEQFPEMKHQARRDGVPPLSLAVSGSESDIVKWMFNEGMDINEQWEWSLGGPSLGKIRFALMECVMSNQYDMIEFLLENGANPNLRSGHGSTPLMSAAEYASVATVELLIDKGAEFEDTIDSDGDNYVMCAVANEDVDVLRWFLKRSTDREIVNRYGFSPMLRASLFPRVDAMKMLHEAGFKPHIPVTLEGTATDDSSFDDTCVYYAYRALTNYTVRRDIRGRYSPLMIAAHKGHVGLVEYLYHEISQIRTCEDKDGNDAMTYACCAGHLSVVKLLWEGGVDPKRLNKGNRTVLEEAKRCLEYINNDQPENLGLENTDGGKEDLESLQGKVSDVMHWLEHVDDSENDSGHDSTDSEQEFNHEIEDRSQTQFEDRSQPQIEATINDQETLELGNSTASPTTSLLEVPTELSTTVSGVEATDHATKADAPLQMSEAASSAEKNDQKIEELKRRLYIERTGRRENTF